MSSSDLLHHFWSLIKAFTEVPAYHLLLEGILFFVIGGLLVRRVQNRSKKTTAEQLSKEEEEELLAEWKPEPLVPEVELNHPALNVPVIEHKAGKTLKINGVDCVDWATHNYLGFAGNEDIEEAAIECIQQYGVGSCGPRAFYGTADVHVFLEEKLAKFFGAEQAVLYSYGFSTIASAIPAYAKKGDVIFADEMVHFQVQKAFDASRSKIKYFKHNDLEHLEDLLLQQAKEDKTNPKLAKVSRRFLVVEGIYMNTGKICPLKELMEIKKKYKLRLMIDETVSFGTLGQNGRGVTEHFNIPVSDVDLIMATLEHSMGSIGGFCIGSSYVVEHQTLAGLGYCFSASLPPMFAAAVLKAIDIMKEKSTMFNELRDKCSHISNGLLDLPGIDVIGDSISPIKHIILKAPYSQESRDQQRNYLKKFVDRAREEKIALTLSSYLENFEVNLPPASIRLAVSNLLTYDDIDNGLSTMKSIAKELFA